MPSALLQPLAFGKQAVFFGHVKCDAGGRRQEEDALHFAQQQVRAPWQGSFLAFKCEAGLGQACLFRGRVSEGI